MSLVLTLEQGPRAQTIQQAQLDHGELVIGRSAGADWQIDDPDMYVSRAHCTITGSEDGYFVTDTSSSGLFIDDATDPLGSGNTARLRNGTRLRLGEYVIWADVRATAQPGGDAPVPPAAPLSIEGDNFFSARTEEPAKAPRPSDLPNPFDHPEAGGLGATSRPDPDRPLSPAFDDPFSLDPLPSPNAQESAPHQGYRNGSRGDLPDLAPQDFWADPAPAPVSKSPPVARAPVPQPRSASSGSSDAALRAAFLRGMGFESSEVPSRDPLEEMETFGREYRLMMEGLMQLLRKRAEEKGNARVAQTVVGASQVNPLKFLPTVDDALAMIVTDRSPGFLAGEPAIADAVRDLAQHHVRAWRGVQGALRRMIDRFDPAAIEEELKSSSTVETLLAGGRSAKLWELYQKRHREISTNAESRFLGDLGADFRKAYEEE